MNTHVFTAIDKYAGKPTDPSKWRLYNVETERGEYRGCFIVHPEWDETTEGAFADWKELYKIGTSWSSAELDAFRLVFKGYGIE